MHDKHGWSLARSVDWLREEHLSFLVFPCWNMSTKSLDQKYVFFSDWKCPPPSSWLTSTLEDELKHLGWFSLMPTSILKMRGWRVCAHFELCNSDNQCLSKCIWCEAQQIRLILMKIWTDLTWNSVDNLIIRRAIWWTEALPDLWTGLATQCPAENTVIHESYWHMDVDRYTVYIIQCIL